MMKVRWKIDIELIDSRNSIVPLIFGIFEQQEIDFRDPTLRFSMYHELFRTLERCTTNLEGERTGFP
jgi:hypothetical protein